MKTFLNENNNIPFFQSTAALIFIMFASINISYAQTFTRITDLSNPVVTDSFPRGYPGAAWIDYNNDGNLDLFVSNDYLYTNNGNGNFTKNLTFKGRTAPITPPTSVGSGGSWADYDNDGDLDFYSAGAHSFLFRNDGNGNFTKITDGDIGDSIGNRGWTAAWADYDNDGNVDLIVVHPAGFVPGGPIPNRLYHNDGPPNYTFTRQSGYEFVTLLAPYTVATWSDFDLDGDVDLFIGSGPANGTTARDYLYKNTFVDNDSAGFERIGKRPIGVDLQDGQVWNWIDYDNDGDLDGFLTNYKAPNRFYINNNSKYTDMPANLALGSANCLANAWGDFDNDGFLDVIITSEFKTYFFHNNGDGTFTSITNNLTSSNPERGVTIGDYDNDGDLDLFIAGFSGGNGIYRNDNDNGNGWIKLKLIGMKSNKAAIGAKVKLKATISGKTMWQFREVSAQNSFNSQNSLIVHFGIGDAKIIDSLVVIWPSRIIDAFKDISPDQFKVITEGEVTKVNEKSNLQPDNFILEQNYPNPFNPSTKIKFSLTEGSQTKLIVYNVLGKEVASLLNEYLNPGNYRINFDAEKLPSGIYMYKLTTAYYAGIKKMVLIK
jgi:hypothetical protein